MKLFIIKLMPWFLKRLYIQHLLSRLNYSQIEQFNRWYRDSEIKRNVDKRKQQNEKG